MTVPGDGQNPSSDPQPQDPQQDGGQQPPQEQAAQQPAPQTPQPAVSSELPPLAPDYGPSAPTFGAPAPGHGSPAPVHGSPAPQHGSPAPSPYGSPSPAPQPGPAAAPAGMTPEELKQKLGAAGLTNPLPSLAVGGATYVGGLIMSVVAIVLLAISAMIAGIGNPVEASLDTVDLRPQEAISGIGSALRFPFQLIALAMLGGLGFSQTMDGVSASFSVRLLPAGITLVMVLLSFYGGRFVQRRQGGGQLGIWVSAVIAGFAVALVTVLAALIFAQPIPVTDDVTLRLHAAGFDSFFGAFFLITLAHALGRISMRPRPAWWPLVTDLTAGLKLAVTHALFVTVVGFLAITVVTSIQALIHGEVPPVLSVILLLPLLGGYVLAYITGFELLSSLSASVTGSGLMDSLLGGISGSEYFSVFSLEWYAWLGALVLIPVGLIVAALLWQHQRRVVPNNLLALVVSWLALPVAYFTGALVLMILARLSAQMVVSGGFMESERFGASLGLAAWTPLLAGVAGVLVELLSRFVMPLVAPYLPGRALSWFRRPLAPAPAAAAAAPAAMAAGAASGLQAQDPVDGPTAALAQTDAPAADGVYATVPVSGAAAGAASDPSGQPVAEPRPLSPKARKLLIGGGIAAGGALVLVVGLTIAVNVVASTVFSPEKQVDAYLGALQEGDAATAVEISAPNVPAAEQVLLTDAIAGAAEQRISGYEIVDSEGYGDDAMAVTAEITQDGVTTTRTFYVERSGRTALVFPEWQMAEAEYAFMTLQVPAGATTILVNGQEVAVDSLALEDGYAMAAVLPGQYTVGLPSSSEFLTAVEGTVFVGADPGEWYDLHAELSYDLNDAGVAEIQSQVDALIDECATSEEADPGEDCIFDAYTGSRMVEGSGSWTVDTYPVVEVDTDHYGEGWSLSSYESPGQATFSYQREGWSEDDDPTDETYEDSLRVSGSATVDENGELVVELSDGW